MSEIVMKTCSRCGETKPLEEFVKDNYLYYKNHTKDNDVYYIFKCKNKLDISVYTMNLILDEAIKKEKERIDKLIDMEIEKYMKSKQ